MAEAQNSSISKSGNLKFILSLCLIIAAGMATAESNATEP
jgi:hypothetical protein